MVSALVPGTSGSGLSCGRRHGVVLGVWCWARHWHLTVPLSTQEYKWILVNCWGNLTNCGRVICDGLASCPEGVEILLATSCYRDQDKFRQLWPIDSKASLFWSSKYNLTINCICNVHEHVHINYRYWLIALRDLISPSDGCRPHILTDESVDAETMIVRVPPSLDTGMVMAATEFTASWCPSRMLETSH